MLEDALIIITSLNIDDHWIPRAAREVGRVAKPNPATSYRGFKPTEASDPPFHIWEMEITQEK